MDEARELLETRLGYSFRNPELLSRALTHKSRAFEESAGNGDRSSDNEQLEFLGDAILGFLISELLVSRHPSFPEGRLSKLKAYLVSASHLFEVAQRLDLGRHLFLGRGEELSGGREKRALLGDAVEAILAAIYADGGIDPTRAFVLNNVVGDFDFAKSVDESLVVDYKSALQEAAQAMGLPMPRYLIVKETGPEHKKTFIVEARVGPQWADRAEGTSKKAAGQRAAELVLGQLTGAPEVDGQRGGSGSAVEPPSPA
ncbi:MAG: ribonuclease III [Acidobacteriia bacterium]|nr:ribonuclease III [Terriglobia bacterium]